MYFQHANKPGRNSRGASLVEYALLVALISIVAMASVASAGNKIRGNVKAAAICMDGDETDCADAIGAVEGGGD